MSLVSLRQLLDHAAEHHYGLPAFNVNNLEQILAIMQATDTCDSPVILQASAGARKYAGEAFLRKMVEAALETYPHIPICMHQDHGGSPAVCQASIRSGFSSVMMDGSLKEDMKTPSTYDYNVEVTRKVVDFAHYIGVLVEGELGCQGSLESGQAGEEDGSGAEGVLSHEQMLTDPIQAFDFVKRTGVDALAIAIGTSHGAYKFSRKPTGDMKETYGVPVEEIMEGIKHGVRKINIDTDIRLAMSGTMRRGMALHPTEFDPRQFFKDATAAAKDVCQLRFEAFGSAGRASQIKVIPLESMAQRYGKAEFDAIVRV